MQLACGEMCFFFTSSLRMLLECCCSSWQEEETSRRLLLLVNFQESWRKIHSSVFCHFIQEDPSLSVRKLGIPLEPPTPTREEIRGCGRLWAEEAALKLVLTKTQSRTPRPAKIGQARWCRTHPTRSTSGLGSLWIQTHKSSDQK